MQMRCVYQQVLSKIYFSIRQLCNAVRCFSCKRKATFSSYYFPICIGSSMSNRQNMHFHVHVNTDLPWLNLTPLSAFIATDVAANEMLGVMSCLWCCLKRLRLIFLFCVIGEFGHTVQFSSLLGLLWNEYLKGWEGGVFLCVCFWVVKFLEQTLLAALHSNQITRQGVHRIWALKLSQVLSWMGLCAHESQWTNGILCV